MNVWKILPLILLAMCFVLSGCMQENEFVYQVTGNELEIHSWRTGNDLTITVACDSDDVPVSAFEALAVGEYEILDDTGKPVASGNDPQYSEISEGSVTLTVPLEGIPEGSYTLVVHSFLGNKKADPPLTVMGTWECNFHF